MSSVAKSSPVLDLASNGDASLFLEMRDAFSQLDHEPLRQVLLDSLAAEKESVQAIARSFGGFLAGSQPSTFAGAFLLLTKKPTTPRCPWKAWPIA